MATEQTAGGEAGRDLAAVVASLRDEVARLSSRLAALEEAARARAAAPPVAAGPSPEELAVILGAAVAAFLGKRAPIRQIRLVSSSVWVQQGRVSVQASHQIS
jgi:methylmalonyl-CoA carboxyltransferase large subunit